MRKAITSLAIAAFVGVAGQNSHAATTNLLQTVSLTLSIYAQGPSTTNKSGTVTSTVTKSSFDSKNLITAVAGDLGIPVSSKASLDLVNTVYASGTNTTYTTNKTNHKVTTNTVVTFATANPSPSGFSIVDGSTITPIPFGYISALSSAKLDASVVGTNGITTSQTEDSVSTVTLTTTTISFAASGFATSTLEKAATDGKSTLYLNNHSLSVAGSGTKGAAFIPILVDGAISTSSGGILIVK